MHHEKVELVRKQGDGYVIPLGPVSLVCVVTDRGMVGCGAYDVAALDRFDYPAARVRSAQGGSITTIDDLLSGTVSDVNGAAMHYGIAPGMSGREALEHM